MNLENTLGLFARQREIWVLQVINQEGPDVPGHRIEELSRQMPVCENSQPPGIPFLYTLFSIAQDLLKYELIELTDKDPAWTKYNITEKGKELVQEYESL